MIWVILGIVVAIVGGIIAFFVMRFMKGRIRIELPRTTFREGEEIAGKVTVLAKKEIESHGLIVSVVGTEHREYKERDGTRTESTEVFRNDQRLQDAKNYHPEESVELEFSVLGPTSIPETGGVGGMLKAGLNMLTSRKQYIKWHVEARLDCKGLDLVNTQNITMNK